MLYLLNNPSHRPCYPRNGLAPDGTPLRDAAYAFDLVGNRTTTTIDGATETYALGTGNRLATCSSGAPSPETTLAYTHDAAGCVTRIARAGQPALDLSWDDQYRLSAVSTNGVVLEAYGYDPLGRRAYTATRGVTNWHAYVGMHCVANLDSSGTVLRSYTWGPGIDNLLAMTVHGPTETNTYFALTDHLGTVHAMVSSVDSVPSVVESYSYDAWGNVLAVLDASGTPISNHQSAISNRFLFQCREYSWATRLYNFRARWYDPATGRWLSNDPIGISGGLNQYVFCGNDPVNYVDPMGTDIYYHSGAGGHAGVIIDNPAGGRVSYDFQAVSGGWDNITVNVFYGPSETTSNPHTIPIPKGYLRLRTTCEGDARAIRVVSLAIEEGMPYSVFANNCAHMSRIVIRAAGVPIKNRVFDTPGRLEDDLRDYQRQELQRTMDSLTMGPLRAPPVDAWTPRFP